MTILVQFGKHTRIELRLDGLSGAVAAIQIGLWIYWLVASGWLMPP